MLKKVSEWFKAQLKESSEESRPHTIELATAVLLYEIMRADDRFEEQERLVLQQRLEKHFTLGESELKSLLELTTQEVNQAADFVQFTRIINSHYDMPQKREILDSLWHLAYADGKLDAHEEHLIRRIADLLHLPHSQFIQSKLAAQPSQNH